jgi:hypothetical protein
MAALGLEKHSLTHEWGNQISHFETMMSDQCLAVISDPNVEARSGPTTLDLLQRLLVSQVTRLANPLASDYVLLL